MGARGLAKRSTINVKLEGFRIGETTFQGLDLPSCLVLGCSGLQVKVGRVVVLDR